MDKLFSLFYMQKKFQKQLRNDIYSQEYREKMIMACFAELNEMLSETPWKPWKKEQTYNIENFRHELIDLWHFVINLSLAVGYDKNTLYNDFIKKHNINIKRQKNGY